jgi:formate-nitrite transporter family protein
MTQSTGAVLAIPVNDRDHTLGPPDATVIVVNYGDYQCPDCRESHKQVQRLIDKLQSKVRFVYRHFPLINVHPEALRAAEAAEAAGAQGKFWEMHRLLYTSPNKLKDRDLRAHAKAIGLDVAKFDREMADSTYASQILKDYYNAITYGVTGTPTTFINGELYAMTGVELLTVVQTILANASANS